MAYKDLREFLKELDKRGYLHRITAEVDWNEEVGAIAQEAMVRKGPALLFENIKDYKDTHGRRLVTNIHESMKRVNLILDLPEDSHPLEAINVWRERTKNPIKPLMVDTGPCKEIIEKDEEVNLLEFPVPKLHSKDGGRYIMTWHIVVTKDPETGWVNLGTYRGMVHDKSSIGIMFSPIQHCAIHGRKYLAMGRSMPVAVAIGLDPVLVMTSSATFPAGVNEYDMAGALRKEPVELVRCETVDLPIPATAEIVLEGEISLDPKTFKPEGPFGEYPGHYSTLWAQPAPVFKVNCVTHRQDPILRSRMVGVISPSLITEHGSFLVISRSAMVWDQLEAHGVQGITGVLTDEPGGTITFISIDKLYYGHAKQVAAALWSCSLSSLVGKFLVVVDSDVDIFDAKKVNVAIANRTQGTKDIIVYPGTFGGPLDPGNSPEIKIKTGGIGNWDRVLIDATWPFEWEAREEWGGLKHPPSCLAEEEIMEKVRKRWKEYGLV